MISDKQLEASRRHAKNSTGPETIEGKARASRNNLRHGLTGQVIIMPNEDREGATPSRNEFNSPGAGSKLSG
jgi:hypothetical protein